MMSASAATAAGLAFHGGGVALSDSASDLDSSETEELARSVESRAGDGGNVVKRRSLSSAQERMSSINVNAALRYVRRARSSELGSQGELIDDDDDEDTRNEENWNESDGVLCLSATDDGGSEFGVDAAAVISSSASSPGGPKTRNALWLGSLSESGGESVSSLDEYESASHRTYTDDNLSLSEKKSSRSHQSASRRPGKEASVSSSPMSYRTKPAAPPATTPPHAKLSASAASTPGAVGGGGGKVMVTATAMMGSAEPKAIVGVAAVKSASAADSSPSSQGSGGAVSESESIVGLNSSLNVSGSSSRMAAAAACAASESPSPSLMDSHAQLKKKKAVGVSSFSSLASDAAADDGGGGGDVDGALAASLGVRFMSNAQPMHCRICERFFARSWFAEHHTCCARFARSMQLLSTRNIALQKLAQALEKRIAQPLKPSGKARRSEEVAVMRAIQTLCCLPMNHVAGGLEAAMRAPEFEKVKARLGSKSNQETYCDVLKSVVLPGGLLSGKEFEKARVKLEESERVARREVGDEVAAQAAKETMSLLRQMKTAFEDMLCECAMCSRCEQSSSRRRSGAEEENAWNERLSTAAMLHAWSMFSVDQGGDPVVARVLATSAAAAVQSATSTPRSATTAGVNKGGGSMRKRSQLPGISDFNVLKPISRGAFGRVYLARKQSSGDLFAIKVLQKDDMVEKQLVGRVITERDIFAEVSNPLIVRFFWSFQSQKRLYLAMEYVPGGDMYSLLCNLGFLDEVLARRYIAETICAVEYLHKLGIIHRDLKPDNLLIAKDGHVKLTDFGLSKYEGVARTGGGGGQHAGAANGVQQSAATLDCTGNRHIQAFESALEGEKLRGSSSLLGSEGGGGGGGKEEQQQADNAELVGTPDYLAPELLLGTGHDYGVDWWALGVILYEFLMGIPPFHDASPERIFENILSATMEWPVVPDEMTEEACDLIRRLLDHNPKTRLGANGAAEIKAHAYFDGLNWDSLLTESSLFVPDNSSAEDTSYFNSRNPMSALSFDQEYTGVSSTMMTPTTANASGGAAGGGGGGARDEKSGGGGWRRPSSSSLLGGGAEIRSPRREHLMGKSSESSPRYNTNNTNCSEKQQHKSGGGSPMSRSEEDSSSLASAGAGGGGGGKNEKRAALIKGLGAVGNRIDSVVIQRSTLDKLAIFGGKGGAGGDDKGGGEARGEVEGMAGGDGGSPKLDGESRNSIDPATAFAEFAFQNFNNLEALNCESYDAAAS